MNSFILENYPKENIISYQEIEKLKKKLKIKKKTVAMLFANLGYKFDFKNICLNFKTKLSKENVIEYMEYDAEILRRKLYSTRNILRKYVAYLQQLRVIYNDLNQLEENFEIISNKYVPLEHKIALTAGYNNTDIEYYKDHLEIVTRKCSIKQCIVIMAISNIVDGKAFFRY